jgi:hypothetical protein
MKKIMKMTVILKPVKNEKKTHAIVSFREKELSKLFFGLCNCSSVFDTKILDMNGVQVLLGFNPIFTLEECIEEINQIHDIAVNQ